MDINLNLVVTSVKKACIKFLYRFHVVIFVILVVGGAAIMVFALNSIVIRSSESDGYTSNTNNATFDQATMKRIDELKTRDQSSTTDLPSGRTNPFIE